MARKNISPINFIQPFFINGLEGRFIYYPSKQNPKNNILIVYDIDSNIEKWWGLVIALSRFGNVTMMDLPGMGGMDSFYKIKQLPTVYNYGNYLAAFIKLRFRRKRLHLIGLGYGVAIITSMLNQNDNLVRKFISINSINGYIHHDDFILTRFNKIATTANYYLFALLPLSFLVKPFTLTNSYLREKYVSGISSKNVKEFGKQFLERFIYDLENETDLRTRFFIYHDLLKLDLCNKQYNIPFKHINIGSNNLKLANKFVEQHFRIVYRNYTYLPSKLVRKIPLVLNDPSIALKMLPNKLRKDLRLRS